MNLSKFRYRIKRLISVVLVLVLVIFTVLPKVVNAASPTGNVTATVTVQSISLSVDVGSVSFGTIGTSDTKDTTTGAKGVDNSITVTNDGNIVEDINVKAGNSTNWTLGASAGSETYTMKSCVTNCDTSPSWTSVGIDPSYARLASSVASVSANTRNLDLQVGTPTSTTQTGEQSITITVQAAALP